MLEGREGGAGSSLVNEHVFHEAGGLEVVSSSVECDSFSNEGHKVLFLVRLVFNTKETGFVYGTLANGIDEVEVFFEQFLVEELPELESFCLCELLSFLNKVLRSHYICPENG